MDFGNARKWTQEVLEACVKEGAKVIDATMGNGYDTKWLCERVGESGHVTAFDIQQAALDATGARLNEAGLSGRATLLLASHDRLDEFVSEKVDAAVFNLGWLPNTPHECTTKTETTLSAVSKALGLVKTGGVLTICVYPGHPEGERELNTLVSWASGLDDTVYDAVIRGYVNIKRKPPVLISVTRKI